MPKDNYNQETATPSKASDANALLAQLFSSATPLTLFTGARNLADIVNLSQATKSERKRGRRPNKERSQSIPLLHGDQALLETTQPDTKPRHKLSLVEERSFAVPSRRESGHDMEAFVRIPVRKAKNEIVRQPESLANRQLLVFSTHDFESDSENTVPCEFEYAGQRDKVSFAHKSTVKSTKRIKKAEGHVFDLLDFVQRRDDKTRLNKVYACKYCPKVYTKRAALGGHTAKNHPHLSDSYKVRQISMSNRKIERERFDFFKQM